MIKLLSNIAKIINEQQFGIFKDLAEKDIQNMGNWKIEKMFFQYYMSMHVLMTYPTLNNFVKKGLITGFLNSDFNK